MTRPSRISGKWPLKTLQALLDPLAACRYSSATPHFVWALSKHRVETRICSVLWEDSVAVGDAGLVARIEKEASATNQFKTFLSRYFYFCMSLVLAGLVILGFSRTVNANLFHANPPRPL